MKDGATPDGHEPLAPRHDDLNTIRACIIGAGSSGIAAAKALQERAIAFDCFDKSSFIGGLWAANSPGSGAYRTLHINSYRKDMEYADYPMSPDLPDFPHHEQIYQYFNDYVDKFDLRSRITLETGVQRAELDIAGRWQVSLSTGEVRHYDALLVANGHHGEPRWPDPPYPGEFSGVQIHSHDYRDLAQLAGRSVLVVGMGNSAMDIAVESSYVARRTFLSSRRGAYIIPKYLFGYPEFPLPIGDRRLPWRVRQLLLQTVVRIQCGPVTRYGLPKPEHKILQTHPTVSDGLLSRLAHGAICPKPAIARFADDQVQFVDGSSEQADTIVFCTGYRITFPFFAEGLISAPDNRLRLFARVFDPDVSNVFFIGFIQPWGAIMPIAEAQSKLVADYLCGSYALPPRAEMLSAIKRQDDELARRYVASKRHTIQVDKPVYLHQLQVERVAGQDRAHRRGRRASPQKVGQ